MFIHLFNSTVVSGPETLVMPALRNFGKEVLVVFLSEERKSEAAKGPVEYAKGLGLECAEITVRKRYDKGAIAALSKLLVEKNPQVVHSHDVKASTYLLRASERIKERKFKIVSTHHGIRGRVGCKNKIYEWYYANFILPKFDLVLTVCSSDREILISRGLKALLVKAHLNGVDRKKVLQSERAALSSVIRKSWGLDKKGIGENAVIGGVVARLSGEKRHDMIFRIFQKVIATCPAIDLHLLCFGSGPLDAELSGRVKSLGLENRIHMMGYRKGLGEEAAGFDFMLSLSMGEGLPVNLIEAGWAATPVVANAIDGIRDLVSTPEEGLLLDDTASESKLAAEIAGFISDKNRRMLVGRKFQERVEKYFSEKAWVEKLKQLYAGL